ncbi:MAG: HpaII family restriction endonuclease [Lachnospiraceae bacterium]
MEREKMSGNKGEWSELYVFMKLLSQGKVYAADEQIQRLEDIYYPILKIIREEQRGERIDYIIEKDEIRIEKDTQKIKTISRKEIEKKANELLEEIQKAKGSFKLGEIERFVNEMEVTKIKSSSRNTVDIFMQIQDIYMNYARDVGFSIKSQMGNSPTLINAGKTTNFIYEVSGITKAQAQEINNINTDNKIKDKMRKIREYGGKIIFSNMSHQGFRRNLIMIDSNMPQIVGEMLLYFYNEDIRECKSLIRLLGERDPFRYEDSIIYEYKFKQFLCSCALGMKPAKPWNGLDEANGGYITVKTDGEILAYHIYNRNFFQQYLLDNTVFEKASTSRHDYMKLYEQDGQLYIKLNLQIRFK